MDEPPCLDENQVLAYVERALPQDAEAAAERHLRSCEACAQLAATVLMLQSAAEPPSEAPARAEQLLATPTLGRFVPLGELGRGSMGRVLAAYDPELDRRVAIKLVRATGRAA